MSQSLRLYVDSVYTSPYAMSVFVALREKQLDFTLTPLDLEKGEQRAVDYGTLSLTGRVPTLVHDDFALSESSAIVEYLEDTFPSIALFPADRYPRARARQLQAWLRSDLGVLREERSTLVVFHGQPVAPLTAGAQAAADRLITAASSLLPEGTDFLFGQWSIVDVDLALMLNRLILAGDPVPERLVAYARRQWLRPAIQEWLELARPAA
ncbi:glutathione transferase [Pseudomonas sp. dw_358]|uniref:glutathione transferase n=1 Tax=Pseudomonas sp. dw_358 TaxID=2720083 RepID=UPI001BD3A39E|nr:glutathione transferase [Pseudomonas sp. dw_358]